METKDRFSAENWDAFDDSQPDAKVAVNGKYEFSDAEPLPIGKSFSADNWFLENEEELKNEETVSVMPETEKKPTTAKSLKPATSTADKLSANVADNAVVPEKAKKTKSGNAPMTVFKTTGIYGLLLFAVFQIMGLLSNFNYNMQTRDNTMASEATATIYNISVSYEYIFRAALLILFLGGLLFAVSKKPVKKFGTVMTVFNIIVIVDVAVHTIFEYMSEMLLYTEGTQNYYPYFDFSMLLKAVFPLVLILLIKATYRDKNGLHPALITVWSLLPVICYLTGYSSFVPFGVYGFEMNIEPLLFPFGFVLIFSIIQSVTLSLTAIVARIAFKRNHQTTGNSGVKE